ncbi:MAG: hypothetical protein M3Y57_13255, partial [Acidobacteriota bacterium]|nr:hypothetical protein [Acidobacteriota bacterium]
MFTVGNSLSASPIESYIDVPSANATLAGVTSFAGWALDSSNPIATVLIGIDGVPYGPAGYRVNR